MVGPVSKELTGQGSHEHPNLDIVESSKNDSVDFFFDSLQKL